MSNNKNKYGQYMTPKNIVNFMISLSDINKESKILEPCSGKGVFVDALEAKGFNEITAYEIDSKLIKNNSSVLNRSFVSETFTKQFDLVIGNPPYIRWKNLEDELKSELLEDSKWNLYCNSLCDYSSIFIIKAIELLKENGELIFITPEYWLNTTHSAKLRNYILNEGYISDIYHFNETPIFDGVSVSLVIFRFVKNRKDSPNVKIAKYYSKKKLTEEVLNKLRDRIEQPNCELIIRPQFEKNENWTLVSEEILNELDLFENNCLKENGEQYTLKEVCDIGNGMVSGRDKVFQINGFKANDEEKKHVLQVLKAKELEPYTHKHLTRYIFVNHVNSEKQLKDNYPNFFKHLNRYKEELEKRYQYNKKIDYWKWVFLRNYDLFNEKVDRIFVPCKERISNKNYFRFSYVKQNIFPTQDVTAIFKKEEIEESIYYILAYLNSRYVFDWLSNKGIVKGSIVEFSEKPLSSIPFRKIDFKNLKEKKIHDDIVDLVKKYIETEDKEIQELIQEKLNFLFK